MTALLHPMYGHELGMLDPWSAYLTCPACPPLSCDAVSAGSSAQVDRIHRSWRFATVATILPSGFPGLECHSPIALSIME